MAIPGEALSMVQSAATRNTAIIKFQSLARFRAKHQTNTVVVAAQVRRMPGDKVLEVIPVIATGLFAGAALGITVGEQPARELLDAQHAKEHFLESYQRIAVSQVSFAAIGSASSAWLAYKEAGPTRKLNAASAILLASVIPFTALVIKPTNDILRSKEQVSDAEVKKGLKTWSKLHLVRTVASIASFGLATLSLAASHKADPQPVSY